MFSFVPEGADRAEIEAPARRRFGYHNLVLGGREEMIEHFSTMRERGSALESQRPREQRQQGPSLPRHVHPVA